MRVGIISDTHGLLRPEALAALQRADHILHAGDVGDAAILDQLRAIAPVTAIRGNIDTAGTCARLPETEAVELGGLHIYMLHSLAELDVDPVSAGFSAVVSGHTHRAAIELKRGVLYFNPGSAGPRRFQLPVTLGILTITGQTLHPEIIPLL